MRQKLLLPIAAVIAAVAAGIAFVFLNYNVSAKREEFAPPSDIETVIISMDQGLCYPRNCDTFSATIYGNGTAAYFTEGGTVTWQLPKERMKLLGEIIDDFYAMDFFALKDNYEGKGTELPYVTITITIDGETKSVHHQKGYPPEADALERRIENDLLQRGQYDVFG